MAHTLVVLSAQEQAERSIVAVQLATALARRGHTTVLVERDPRQEAAMMLGRTPGGDAGVYPTAQPGLTLVIDAPPPPADWILLHTPAPVLADVALLVLPAVWRALDGVPAMLSALAASAIRRRRPLIVLSRYNSQALLCEDTAAQLTEVFGPDLLRTRIPQTWEGHGPFDALAAEVVRRVQNG